MICDRRTMCFELFRQLQVFSEHLELFIDCESWIVGRNFMEDPTAVMEIDRCEVIAVLHFSGQQTERVDGVHPVELFLLIRRPPRDMVNRSRSRTTDWHLTMNDVNDIPELAFCDVPVNGFRPFAECQAECVCQ